MLLLLFGERLLGMKFIIASSTCDLVENRRENAVLFRIQPITDNDKTAASQVEITALRI
jgi:hypothetical protein